MNRNWEEEIYRLHEATDLYDLSLEMVEELKSLQAEHEYALNWLAQCLQYDKERTRELMAKEVQRQQQQKDVS